MADDKPRSRLAHWPPPRRANNSDKPGASYKPRGSEPAEDADKATTPAPRWHLARGKQPDFDD